ncbi:hypothetical protein IJG04_00720 [Candidatus Saccharibacteria bacterium]|nr:hypothetical protein [Candidatus Saccharibacteria bacterium]
MRITILGRGAYGVALGNILEENKNTVIYYDIKDDTPLEDALQDAEAILMAVPSEAVPALLPKLPHHLPLVVATKGILDIATFADFADLTILSGAGFATDLSTKKPTVLTITNILVSTWFLQDWLEFQITDDIAGVLMCGALKNVYAMEAGRLGLKRDTLEWAEFLGKTLHEMREILAINDADPNTVNLSCGKADLELTCGLPSRNYEFGTLIAQNPNYHPQNTIEGLTTLQKLKNGAIVIPKNADILIKIMEEKWD